MRILAWLISSMSLTFVLNLLIQMAVVQAVVAWVNLNLPPLDRFTDSLSFIMIPFLSLVYVYVLVMTFPRSPPKVHKQTEKKEGLH